MALLRSQTLCHTGRVKRIWYLLPMRAAKVQASLRIRAVSPEPSLLAHTSSESRGTFRQKTRSLAPLNGWACAVEICHDGMLEDTNSLDGAHLFLWAVITMHVSVSMKSTTGDFRLLKEIVVEFYYLSRLLHYFETKPIRLTFTFCLHDILFSWDSDEINIRTCRMKWAASWQN